MGHRVYTELKRPRQTKKKSPTLKRIKHSAILINDYEDKVALKNEKIEKILEQEIDINAIKIEHEKKISALKEGV